MRCKLSTTLALACALLIGLGAAQIATASEAAWQQLQAGASVAILRHARAPGTGDPQNFRLEDCATQRNLSAAGRTQAQDIGNRFREHKVPVERVLSSRWCRSLETARLAFGNRTEPFPPLDSFFSDRGQEDRQTQAVRRIIEEWRSPGVLVLVTHQVNITALTGIFPVEGEILVLKPKTSGGFDLVGRIKL